MNISKQELEIFCRNIEDLEEKKKELADEIKESFKTFATNLEVTPKSVIKFYKEWKEAKKDKEGYVLTDFESDALLLIAMPELSSSPEDTRGN